MVKQKDYVAPEYTAIGNEVTNGAAMIQACMALDLAAQYGVDKKDPEIMLQVAALYIQMADGLGNPDGGGEDGKPEELRSQMGFGPAAPVQEIEGEDE